MAKTAIGLDIGSAAARAVQVTRDKSGAIFVEKFAEEPLPYGSMVNGAVANIDAVSVALKTLWRKGKFSTNEVRVSVGGPAMVARVGELDWEPDSDLVKTLPYSTLVAEKLLESPDQFYLDYHTLSEYVTNEPDPYDPDETITVRKKHALVGGGRREAVDSIIAALRAAKLKPVSVDINGLALLRAHNANDFERAHNSVDCSIDIGAQTILVVMHKAGQPLYIRANSENSGAAATEAIAQTLGVNYSRAEERKFEVMYNPVPMPEDELSSVFALHDDEDYSDEDARDRSGNVDEERALEKARSRQARITPILNESTALIVSSLRETVEFFLGSAWGADLASISGFSISGGVSYTPQLLNRIAAEFGVPVKQATPISSWLSKKQQDKVPVEAMANEAAYAIAFGLAVGEGSTHG